MKKLDRIEIDVLLDDASKRCLMEKARRQYGKGAGAWTVVLAVTRKRRILNFDPAFAHLEPEGRG